jgi:hypothetical protein
VLSTAQRIESVEYAEIVQSVDIEEFGGCRTSVGEIDRVADRENFFFRVIVALLDTPPFYSHFRLIARGKRQVVTDLAALSYPLQFRSVLKWLGGGGHHHLGGFAYYFVVVHNNITARGNSSITSFAPFTSFDSFCFSYSASTSSTVVAEGRLS